MGKTFLATALGHAAIRRRYSVHFERCDRMLRRLRTSRLDNSHDAEVRKLLRVDLLIVDDFALQPLDAADTADVNAFEEGHQGVRRPEPTDGGAVGIRVRGAADRHLAIGYRLTGARGRDLASAIHLDPPKSKPVDLSPEDGLIIVVSRGTDAALAPGAKGSARQ